MDKIRNIERETSQLNLSEDNLEYRIFAEHAVSLDSSYITNMHVKKMSNDIKAALAISSNNCCVLGLSGDRRILLEHGASVTGVKFSPENDNILYTSCLDGKIRIFDLRASDCVKELKDSGQKPLTCLDISSNERVLCAGTELVEDDAFLLFWDIRSRQLLGGYWESQTDDLTSVAFHPSLSDTVAAGSTDGLVNIFDLKESCEDDALQHSLNTENSVSAVSWLTDLKLAVLTHTEVLQLWQQDDAEPQIALSRESVAARLSCGVDDTYLVNAHVLNDGNIFLLAGSSAGKGDCLKLIRVEEGPSFAMVGNRQLVRCSSYLPEEELLFTGGESGCLTVWKAEKTEQGIKKSIGTKTSSRNKIKHKPYHRI